MFQPIDSQLKRYIHKSGCRIYFVGNDIAESDHHTLVAAAFDRKIQCLHIDTCAVAVPASIEAQLVSDEEFHVVMQTFVINCVSKKLRDGLCITVRSQTPRNNVLDSNDEHIVFQRRHLMNFSESTAAKTVKLKQTTSCM